jgi:hypothetical protein
MAGRGGVRPGAGRPKGSRERATVVLIEALAGTGDANLPSALARVIDDATHPMAVRLDAARHLAGMHVAKVLQTTAG